MRERLADITIYRDDDGYAASWDLGGTWEHPTVASALAEVARSLDGEDTDLVGEGVASEPRPEAKGSSLCSAAPSPAEDVARIAREIVDSFTGPDGEFIDAPFTCYEWMQLRLALGHLGGVAER